MMVLDYPNLRASTCCPSCDKPKSKGLVTCWPCWRMICGSDNPDAWTQLLDNLESGLAALDEPAPQLKGGGAVVVPFKR